MVTEPRHDDPTSPVLMLLHQHPQTAELTLRCYFARAVSKGDRQIGDNIPCDRGFANHASASATLPALHPMGRSGGRARTTTLEIGSTVFLMGFFNTILGSEKPIGILNRYLLIAGRIRFFSSVRGDYPFLAKWRDEHAKCTDPFKAVLTTTSR
jgi:hypothetical protein